MVSREDVTSLLIQWGEGDSTALDRLVPLVYDELRRIARAHLRTERTGHTLQPTALVNEAYLRLMNLDRLTFAGRAHFLAGGRPRRRPARPRQEHE